MLEKNEIKALVIFDKEPEEFIVVATGERFLDFFEAVEQAKAVESENFSLEV